MKIIVAGYPKTGTKSMNQALSLLGYDSYDFLEHWWYHGREWIKILNHGATSSDFQQMYKDVDVVLDFPAFFFWKEIHDAFPDSKVNVYHMVEMWSSELYHCIMANMIKN